jgi:hypothetical protein
MSEALETIRAMLLTALVPAAVLLPASRRLRLIIGCLGLAAGFICQMTFDGNVHQSAPILLGIWAGYSVAVGALQAEILRFLGHKLWSWFRTDRKSDRTAKVARD